MTWAVEGGAFRKYCPRIYQERHRNSHKDGFGCRNSIWDTSEYELWHLNPTSWPALIIQIQRLKFSVVKFYTLKAHGEVAYGCYSFTLPSLNTGEKARITYCFVP